MRTWRNWQTRKIQVLMVARLCRFKSCCPHQTRIKRTETIRFVFSYLWFATGLVTMQCIVCTLRVPLHAVQLAQRFPSKLARLCYYARFAHYKSCCPHQDKKSTFCRNSKRRLFCRPKMCNNVINRDVLANLRR